MYRMDENFKRAINIYNCPFKTKADKSNNYQESINAHNKFLWCRQDETQATFVLFCIWLDFRHTYSYSTSGILSSHIYSKEICLNFLAKSYVYFLIKTKSKETHSKDLMKRYIVTRFNNQNGDIFCR